MIVFSLEWANRVSQELDGKSIFGQVVRAGRCTNLGPHRCEHRNVAGIGYHSSLYPPYQERIDGIGSGEWEGRHVANGRRVWIWRLPFMLRDKSTKSGVRLLFHGLRV